MSSEVTTEVTTEGPSIAEVTKNGLWTNNPALVQLLGLCPLLAVTGSVVNALGLGLATMAVLIGSNTIVSLIRNHVSDAVRLPAFVIIIAAFVTCAELLMKAYTYDLYQILGIFIPLIVTNCAILGRAEAFASKHHVGLAALDGLDDGTGLFTGSSCPRCHSRTVWPGHACLPACTCCLARLPTVGCCSPSVRTTAS